MPLKAAAGSKSEEGRIVEDNKPDYRETVDELFFAGTGRELFIRSKTDTRLRYQFLNKGKEIVIM